MLKFVKNAEVKIKNLLQTAGEAKRLDDTDFVLINLLINFFEPFQNATLALEDDHYLAIH